MKIICPICSKTSTIEEKSDKGKVCPNCNPNCNHAVRCGCYVLFPRWFKGSHLEVRQ